MDLFLILLLLLAVGAVVAVALGKVGGGLAPASPELRPPLEGPVSRPSDLDEARFAVALRGYRMDQVDSVLDETRELLAARDEEIARLRRLLGAEPHVGAAPPSEPEQVPERAPGPEPERAPEPEPATADPRPAP